jgi:undecaprenyl-diphosphatase
VGSPPHMTHAPATTASRRPVVAGHLHARLPATPSAVLLARPWLPVALAALLAALALAAALWGGQVLLTWDEPIQRGVEARRTAALDQVFLTVSRFGSTIPVLTLGAAFSAAAWRRCRAVGIALLVATAARPLIEFTVKSLVDRDRPDFERLVAGTGPSFPSGHVMAAIALWGLMPLVVSLYARRRVVWWASVGVAGALIAGISASRIYLGVHWFSDVTGGLIVGAFFLLGIEALLLRQHARHPCCLGRPPDPLPALAVEHGGQRQVVGDGREPGEAVGARRG